MTDRIPPPAHLPLVSASRQNSAARAYRLNENGAPEHDGSPESTLRIIEWLGVERHARWLPGGGVTCCNILAHDLTGILGAFIPRVWWLPNALARIAAGEEVAPVYAVTVGELSANALYAWLEKWSHHYGWQRTDSLDEAQDAANDGRAVVICAPNRNPVASGHISCVAPESSRCRAIRDALGRVVVPVQSQAGGRNVELGTKPHPGAWWLSPTFQVYGFWVHTPAVSQRDTWPAPAPSDPPDTVPSTPPAKRRSSERIQAVDAPIIEDGVEVRIPSAATPLRADEGEHTPLHLRASNDDSGGPPEAA